MSDKRDYVNQTRSPPHSELSRPGSGSALDAVGDAVDVGDADPPTEQPARQESARRRPRSQDGGGEDEARFAGGLLLPVAQDLARDLIDAARAAADPHGSAVGHDDLRGRFLELHGAAAVRGEVADLGHEPDSDLPAGKDGRADHEHGAHALPRGILCEVALSRGVVPEPGSHRVWHVAGHEHGARAAVLDHGEDAARARRAGGAVLDGHAAAAARLAVLGHHRASALGALPRLLAALLELEDDLDLAAALAPRADGVGDDGSEQGAAAARRTSTPVSGPPPADDPTRASTRADG